MIEKLNALASEVRTKFAAMQMNIDAIRWSGTDCIHNESGEILFYPSDEKHCCYSVFDGNFLKEESEFWLRLYREEQANGIKDNIVPLVNKYM